MDPLSLLVLTTGALLGAAATKLPEPFGWSYGHWSPEMLEVLSRVIPGALVFDLGAGPELVESHLAAELGAHRVLALDKGRMNYPPRFPNIEIWRGTFSVNLDMVLERAQEAKAEGRPVVAIVSWPSNNARSELEILDMLDVADFVIYRGHNFSGTACGFRALYDYFLERPVQAVVEHRQNTLIVYGPPGKREMGPIPEELAGKSNMGNGDVIEFEDRHSLLDMWEDAGGKLRPKRPDELTKEGRYRWAWRVYLTMQPDWKPLTSKELVAADKRMEEGKPPPEWSVGGLNSAFLFKPGGFIGPGFRDSITGRVYNASLDVHSLTTTSPWYSKHGPMINRMHNSSPQKSMIAVAKRVLEDLEHGEDFRRFRPVSPSLVEAIIALKAYLDNPVQMYLDH